MKRTVTFILALLFLSCGEEVIEKPENLIPKEEMVNILHDLALLKSAQNNIKPILEHKELTIMEFLYQKYQIDSARLAQSDLYYASIPLEYQAIYEEIDARLEKRKKAMEGRTKKRNDSVREAGKRRKDSIKTLREAKED
ncbi:DUF4296 domain-containing protein [Flagellimonas flava]|uniref:DUF4296 domain-containing protein n=1 Tax=Flagellimonas flava TaxID=570519 RepID=A0A1M5KCL9_9FLAO|nr:DUF4296 domain-containing protein [Allomuricauda flava]SHG50664.1 protein of unknown function [Allomuricauda flava]